MFLDTEIRLKYCLEISDEKLKYQLQSFISDAWISGFHWKIIDIMTDELLNEHYQDAIVDEIMAYDENFRNLLLQNIRLYEDLDINLCLTLSSKILDSKIRDNVLVNILEKWTPEDLKSIFLISSHIEDKQLKDKSLLDYLGQYITELNNFTIFLDYFTDEQIKKIAEDLIKSAA